MDDDNDDGWGWGDEKPDVRARPTEEAKPQPAAPTAPQGGGWGGWGGWGAQLTQVAGGLVREVKDLADGLGEAIKEGLDEEEGDKSHGAAAGPGAGAAAVAARPASASSREDEGGEAPTAPPVSSAPDGGEDAAVLTQREKVLQGLQGEDTVFEQGFRAFDKGVDQVAAGAAGLFGNIFGAVETAAKVGVQGAAVAARTTGSVARTVATEVAQSAAAEFKEGLDDVRELHAVKTAQSNIATAARNTRQAAPQVLGAVGKTAVKVFQTANTLADKVAETVINDSELGEGGGRETNPGGTGEGGSGSAAGGPSDDDLVTFDRAFYIHGGTDFSEELRTLADSCIAHCNRARAKMASAKERKGYEGLVQRAGDMCNLEDELDSDEELAEEVDEYGKRADDEAEGADFGGYGPALERRQRTVVQARALRAGAPEAPDPAAFLKGLKAEGVQQVAEQCAVGLQYLLKLGFSMAAPMRYGRPEDDGVEWPADTEGKARIVRLQGRRLLADLEAVAATFDELFEGVGEDLKGAAEANSADLGGLIAGYRGEVEEACESAAGRILDASNSFAFIVVATELVAAVGDER